MQSHCFSLPFCNDYNTPLTWDSLDLQRGKMDFLLCQILIMKNNGKWNTAKKMKTPWEWSIARVKSSWVIFCKKTSIFAFLVFLSNPLNRAVAPFASTSLMLWLDLWLLLQSPYYQMQKSLLAQLHFQLLLQLALSTTHWCLCLAAYHEFVPQLV